MRWPKAGHPTTLPQRPSPTPRARVTPPRTASHPVTRQSRHPFGTTRTPATWAAALGAATRSLPTRSLPTPTATAVHPPTTTPTAGRSRPCPPIPAQAHGDRCERATACASRDDLDAIVTRATEVAVCRVPGERRQSRQAFLITTADGPDYLVGLGGPVAGRLVGWLRTRRGCDTALLADVLSSCPSRPVTVWRRPGGHLHAIPAR